MKFPPSFLEEIRARLPVSEVVGQSVRLKKQGREWIGLSPFNAEKSPSFTVNDQKGFYHDFSSGQHGDVFSFVMETQGLAFPEAVERLAGMAGLPMPVEIARGGGAGAQARHDLGGRRMGGAVFRVAVARGCGRKSPGLSDRTGHERRGA